MRVDPAGFFEGCYIMQQEDIERFASTLSDGFREYGMFRFICNGSYSYSKMKLFWAVQIALCSKDAICIADSKNANSVMIYIRPGSKEPGIVEYFKTGGIKMLLTIGLGGIIKLLRFDTKIQEVAKRYKSEKDGYLLAFATRLDKQGQGYGKPLMDALLQYLDNSGEGCYLETFKEENVELYSHFSFELMEQTPVNMGGLTLYAMYRSGNKI